MAFIMWEGSSIVMWDSCAAEIDMLVEKEKHWTVNNELIGWPFTSWILRKMTNIPRISLLLLSTINQTLNSLNIFNKNFVPEKYVYMYLQSNVLNRSFIHKHASTYIFLCT